VQPVVSALVALAGVFVVLRGGPTLALYGWVLLTLGLLGLAIGLILRRRR
jgi:hypothetical protein